MLAVACFGYRRSQSAELNAVFGQHFAVPRQVVLLQGGGGGFGVKEAGKLGYEGFPLDMHVSTNQESRS